MVVIYGRDENDRPIEVKIEPTGLVVRGDDQTVECVIKTYWKAYYVAMGFIVGCVFCIAVLVAVTP